MTTSITDPIEVTLRDGRRVTIRPIRRDDAARTAAFIDALSTQSKHALFLGGVTRLSDAAMQRLCNPHDPSDMAYVATVPSPGGERQIGVCRYAGADEDKGADEGMDARGGATQARAGMPEVEQRREQLPGAVAEISVAVADDWQHQGLGKRLLGRLIDHARAHGVRRLYSMDAASNDGMRKLARDLGFSEQRDPDDIHQVIYSLEPQRD
jgi:GNAT superfamily N-acetyltransferase